MIPPVPNIQPTILDFKDINLDLVVQVKNQKNIFVHES